MDNFKYNQNLMEEAKQEFLVEWEQCAAEGSTLNFADFIRKYPSIATELLAWSTTLVARYQTVSQDTEVPEASEHTLSLINGVKEAVRAQPQNLEEAREALGLSQISFGKKLRLPPTVTKGIGRGLGRPLPKVLAEMLATTLVRPVSEVVALLVAPPSYAANYKATSTPLSQPKTPKSFRELLEDADRKGELAPEDKQFWLNHLEAEGL